MLHTFGFQVLTKVQLDTSNIRYLEVWDSGCLGVKPKTAGLQTSGSLDKRRLSGGLGSQDHLDLDILLHFFLFLL